jgi:hypothetical protein
LLFVSVDNVGNYRRVKVAQMRKAVRIIYGRCDVVRLHPKKIKV